MKCIHGAYNFDGSCCTCGAPNVRPSTSEDPQQLVDRLVEENTPARGARRPIRPPATPPRRIHPPHGACAEEVADFKAWEAANPWPERGSADAPKPCSPGQPCRMDGGKVVEQCVAHALSAPRLEPMTELREYVIRQMQQNRMDRWSGRNTVPAIDELESILNFIDNSAHWDRRERATDRARCDHPEDVRVGDWCADCGALHFDGEWREPSR